MSQHQPMTLRLTEASSCLVASASVTSEANDQISIKEKDLCFTVATAMESHLCHRALLELPQCIMLLLPKLMWDPTENDTGFCGEDSASEKKTFTCRSRGHRQTSCGFLFYFNSEDFERLGTMNVSRKVEGDPSKRPSNVSQK